MDANLITPSSPSKALKCCFCFPSILGMRILSCWLLCVTAANYFAANDSGKFVAIVQGLIAVFMLSFLVKDSLCTRKLLVWAMRMRFTSDIVMTVLVAMGLSKGDFTDERVNYLYGVIFASAIFAIFDIHYIMVA